MRGNPDSELHVTTLLGIALGADELRGILLDGATIRWRGSVAMSRPQEIDAAVAELLASAPRTFARSRLGVVVGPRWVQVKALAEFPPVKPARVGNQILRENQRAFFLSRAAPMAIADVHTRRDGSVWGAAFDRDLVDGLTTSLRKAGLRVTRILPAVVAIAARYPGTAMFWNDGADSFHIEGDVEGPVKVDRVLFESRDTPPPSPTALAALGEEASRYVDAHAAALIPRIAPLGWQPDPDARRVRVMAIARGTALGTAVCIAAGFAALGPGLRAAHFTGTARHELESARASQHELSALESELGRVTERLNRLESFRAPRGQMPRMLGELSRSIPESTAVLSFHADSAEGSFTAVAPNAADVLNELNGVDGIDVPRIVGSVTRETLNGAHLERATFRFRRRRAR